MRKKSILPIYILFLFYSLFFDIRVSDAEGLSSKATIQALSLSPNPTFWNKELRAVYRHLDVDFTKKNNFLWIEPYFLYEQLDLNVVNSLNKTLTGFVLAYDRNIKLAKMKSLIVGAYVSYGFSWQNAESVDNTETEKDSLSAGLYFSYRPSKRYFADLFISVNNYGNKYDLETVSSSKEIKYSQLAYGSSLRVGREFYIAGFQLAKELQLDFLRISAQDYAINKNDSVNIGAYTMLAPRVGLRLERPFKLKKGILSPYARVGVSYRFFSTTDFTLAEVDTVQMDSSGVLADVVLGLRYAVNSYNKIAFELGTGIGKHFTFMSIGTSLRYEFSF